MSTKWNALSLAYGPQYAVQVDTWAAHVRRAGGRPYVLCDYRPQDRDGFWARRPGLIREGLEKCAEVGRIGVTVTDIDARFRRAPGWASAFEVARIDAGALWRPGHGARYEPGVMYLRQGEGAEEVLKRWERNLASGQPDDVALTDALLQARALGLTIAEISETEVSVPQWGHTPASPTVEILERGWEDIEVTPETVGRQMLQGAALIGE